MERVGGMEWNEEERGEPDERASGGEKGEKRDKDLKLILCLN